METEELEKWRKEHSMDYVKALKVLNKFPDEHNLSKLIYKIIKAHVPEIVYKYYSFTNDEVLNAMKLDTLSNKEIFLSFSDEFNDPYDNKSFFYNMDLIQKYQFGFLFDKDFIDEIAKTSRFASFSASGYGSLPMWAHYSNNHQGFCVSYSTNFKDNPELSPQIFPVQYVEGRVDITQHLEVFLKHMDNKYNEAQKKGNNEIILTNYIVLWIKIFMAFIKEKQWDYEKEFRIKKPNNTQKPDKMKANPNAIYIGHKCKDEHKMKLINIAFQFNIPIYQMEVNYSSQTYELMSKQIFI